MDEHTHTIYSPSSAKIPAPRMAKPSFSDDMVAGNVECVSIASV